jgi:pyruvate kinase
MKRTKIVCTIGPSTEKIEMIEELLKNGMNVARFNFSHGNHEEQKLKMDAVKEASRRTGIPVGLMLDTKGPEMRLGTFKAGKVFLEKGKPFLLTGREIEGDENGVSINHQTLASEVKPGDAILLSDGLIELVVESTDGFDIHTVVQNNGDISNNKRIAAPGVSLNLPPLSKKDISDILFGIEEDVDFIAASFVQRASDALAIRRLLEERGASIQIIAKIENAEGVKNMEEILDVVDGFMVARGDLGVEIPAEDVPLIQKRMIRMCNEVGKPVITATQMLESMIANPRPTRAEASDVANAILDGTDAIMLSGETASGQYPIEAVKTMNLIAKRIEVALNPEINLTRFGHGQTNTTNAISHATVQISLKLNAKAVITATESGFTAQMVSRYRPHSQIIAVSPHEKTVRKLQLVWGVFAIKGASRGDTDTMTQEAMRLALEEKYISEGDLVIVTAGVPIGTTGTTNMIQVHIAGEALLEGQGIGKKAVSGRVAIVRDSADAEKFTPGDILVSSILPAELGKIASQASGIILEEDGLTSAGAIIAVTFGIPAIVGVKNALQSVQNGMEITLDPTRGKAFHGKLNLH